MQPQRNYNFEMGGFDMTNKEAIVNRLELVLKELKRESGGGSKMHAIALENLIKTMKNDYRIGRKQ